MIDLLHQVSCVNHFEIFQAEHADVQMLLLGHFQFVDMPHSLLVLNVEVDVHSLADSRTIS